MKRPAPRRGATALEFALVLPVIVALFSGTIDGAMFLCQRSAVIDAANAGARAGAVSGDEDTVLDDATAAVTVRLAASGFGGEDVSVTATREEASTPLVRVLVSVPFRGFVGLLPMPVTLSAVATVRYENTSST